MDAIESGIVKVPRVPVSDDSMVGDLPKYRDLWVHVRDALPRKGLKDTTVGEGDPVLPKVLEGALESLYGDYARFIPRLGRRRDGPPAGVHRRVLQHKREQARLRLDCRLRPHAPGRRDGGGARASFPCSATSTATDGATAPSASSSTPCSWTAATHWTPPSSGPPLARSTSSSASTSPGSPAAARTTSTEEDILREVLNTVGKPDRLGADIRCVVSVSMLTEGWDANTVTHVLGIRAFGTQLLCEQVVGRALRRASYDPTPDGMFEPEYAEVLGVPFTLPDDDEAGHRRGRRSRSRRSARSRNGPTSGSSSHASSATGTKCRPSA